MENLNSEFWAALDQLVLSSGIIIDRPRGSAHPRYPDLLYPVSYGYLNGTSSMDGGGIDIWTGTAGNALDAILCTVDLLKKDSEIKLLLGCTEDEKSAIWDMHNRTPFMKGILIRR